MFDPAICYEPPVNYFNDTLNISILNDEIDLDDVCFCLSKLKNNKGPGPDEILNEIIFCAKDILAPFFQRIFQYIFKNHLFPNEWRKSIIKPIFKRGEINNCNNYRPIALSSLLSKVLTNV